MPMTNIVFKIARICHYQEKCNYLKNKNLFLNSFSHFWNPHQIFNILKEKMTVIANVFPKLQTVKNLFKTICKKCRFRTCFDSQHVKAFQIHAKSPWDCFYQVFSSFSGKLIRKMSPLALGEILEVFVNTLIPDGKSPAQHCENLQLPIQMQLSEKRKTVSQFFVPFLESPSNFKCFEKKDNCHS